MAQVCWELRMLLSYPAVADDRRASVGLEASPILSASLSLSPPVLSPLPTHNQQLSVLFFTDPLLLLMGASCRVFLLRLSGCHILIDLL